MMMSAFSRASNSSRVLTRPRIAFFSDCVRRHFAMSRSSAWPISSTLSRARSGVFSRRSTSRPDAAQVIAIPCPIVPPPTSPTARIVTATAVGVQSGLVWIAKQKNFFAKYNLFAQGEFDPAISNTPSNSTPDIEEVYVVWRKALDTPINLKIGRFRPTLSLWKKNNKITVSDFATTSYRIGNSQFALESSEDALEANAVLGNRVFVAGGIVDRNGQDTKEGYGHLSFKIGGSDFLGKEPEVDLDQESMWDYFSLTIAGYGYVGRNSISLASSQRNNFYRAGVDLDAHLRDQFLAAGELGHLVDETQPRDEEDEHGEQDDRCVADATVALGVPAAHRAQMVALFHHCPPRMASTL